MFVQVIKGRTSHDEALREQFARWALEIRSGAVGFLGATEGTGTDGTTIAIVQFDDEATARANEIRPEQSAWWAETVVCFKGEPTVLESSDVELILDGPSHDAAFVQVIEGRISDRSRLVELNTPELLDDLRRVRPDLIGGLLVWLADGWFIEVAYFTGEEDARSAESSPEFAHMHEEVESLYESTTFVDLAKPNFIH